MSGIGDILSGLAVDGFELWLIGPSPRDIAIVGAVRAHRHWNEADLGSILAAFNPLDYVKGDATASAYARVAVALIAGCSAFDERTRRGVEESLWAALSAVDRRPPRDALRLRRLVRCLHRMHRRAYSNRYSHEG